ncbi:MAG TPA: fibronectin type III domain-containing protein, partial [Steroidobacteraceae bacterium]
ATGSYSATSTQSPTSWWVMQMAAFRAASGGDTTPPSAPSTLVASAASSTQINLSWTASSDNVGVTNYLVERCQGAGCTSFAQIGTSPTTTYNDTAGLIASTSYTYQVRATDAAGNLSGYSNTYSATTGPGSVVAIASVQSAALDPVSGNTVAVKYAAAQSAGDLNVVVIGWNNSTAAVNSVTDSNGNPYLVAAGPTTIAGNGTQVIYYAQGIAAAAAGANTVTVTFNATVPWPDVRIVEYSGISTSGALDIGVGASGTGTNLSSGAGATSNANDLLVGANYIGGGFLAVGSGYTQRLVTTPDSDLVEDRVVAATGSYSATSTQSPTGWWVMQMAAFRAAGSGGGDTTPPSAPSTLVASAASSTQINLSWTASTDNVAVTKYLVERCQGVGCTGFAQIGTSVTTTYNDTAGLIASTSYSYRVRATDAAGNLSGYSNTYSATTSAAADTTPPSAPSGLTATAASSTQINLGWVLSTDNVGVTKYLVERCQGASCTSFAQIGTATTTTYNDTAGLTAATSYSYRVRATDAAGNLSGYSNTASTPTSGGTVTIGSVQSAALDPASGNTVSVSYGAAQNAGDLNVVVIGWNDSTSSVTSVVDSKSNPYLIAAGPTTIAGKGTQVIYYAQGIAAAAAGANTVTVTFNATVPWPDVRIVEYSGISTSGALDIGVGASGTGTNLSSGAVATTNANDLLVGANYIGGGFAAVGSGYTQRLVTTPDGDLVEDRAVSATG